MKNYKKISIFGLMLIIALAFTAGCGGTNKPTTTSYVDGKYFAEMPEFDDKGWKDNATVTIRDGKIDDVILNAINEDPAKGDKLTAVANGEYDMKAAGAKADWDEQAKAIEDYIIEKQGATGVTFDEEGKSDAISGATIHYNQFFDLVNQALDQAKAK
ncbi:FMN-binding protein [Dehalobacterium formicoaceticum]|uniref:FMN-binding protein n=1 Tax=Dehalobacterium formicoaceticum TaxID=51515 RepID=A0ABT1Y2C8_9FIRM|nr:FMN-binding protein [Dehalobacterium formicoaceticum]MCR6545030.1 FMN-binding protein [Dehalobacterium formicoaceticum]